VLALDGNINFCALVCPSEIIEWHYHLLAHLLLKIGECNFRNFAAKHLIEPCNDVFDLFELSIKPGFLGVKLFNVAVDSGGHGDDLLDSRELFENILEVCELTVVKLIRHQSLESFKGLLGLIYAFRDNLDVCTDLFRHSLLMLSLMLEVFLFNRSPV
jgi:hypothetical protein